MSSEQDRLNNIRDARIRLAKQRLASAPKQGDHLSVPDQETGEPVSPLISGLRGAAQGATFGFSDEIMAGVKSIASEKTFDQLLDEEQEKLRLAKIQQPAAFEAGHIGGGLLSMAAAPQLGLAKAGISAARLAGTGAASGALSGFGSTDGDLSNRLQGAGIGSAAGLGTGLLGSAIGKVLQKSSNLFSEALSGRFGAKVRNDAKEAVAKSVSDELSVAKRSLQDDIVKEEQRVNSYLITKQAEDKVLKEAVKRVPILDRLKKAGSVPQNVGQVVEDFGAFQIGGPAGLVVNRLRKEFGPDALMYGNRAFNSIQEPVRNFGRRALPAIGNEEGNLFAPENDEYLRNQLQVP